MSSADFSLWQQKNYYFTSKPSRYRYPASNKISQLWLFVFREYLSLEMELERVCPLLLAALVAVCYSNSLRSGLAYDDQAAIRDNRDLRPHTPITNIFFNDFWGTPLRKEGSHKSYRPLTVLSFRANYAVHGLKPFGYHLINVLLHALVCFLFYRLCLHFSTGISSLVSSALFAVHPVHTEAVTGVVGRAELLSAVAFLCALLYYIHSRYQHKTNAFQECCVTSILAVLGLLCKEQGLTVLAICCIYELVSPKNQRKVQSIRYLMLGRVSPWLRDRLLRISLLLTAAAGALYFRCKIMGPKLLPAFSRFDNPAAASPTPTRQLTYNYLLSVNAWLLLFPCNLCCDWAMSTIPLVMDIWDVRNLASILFYACIFFAVRSIFRLEEESRLSLIMSLSLLTVPFLPASNLFFPVGFVVAERVLYIPSMGFCMIVAQGWCILWEKRTCKQLAAAGILFLLAVHVLKTIRRNEDWRTEYSLYSSALAVNQRNAKLYNNMGKVLEALNRHEEALSQYKEAIRIQSDDVRGYLNVGRVLTHLRRYEEAEGIYLQAKALFPGTSETKASEVRVTPNHLQLFLNLAFLISRNDSRLEEADALYREAITLRSDFTNAYLNRGDVLLKMNRTKEAEAMYQRALEFDDSNPDLYFNLGIVLMDQGRNDEALQLFNKALDIDPEHEKSLEFSAVLIHESGMSRHKNLARDRLEKIVDRGKETERVYISLGLMSIENKDFHSAERCFKKALVKKPDSREALFNLALLLSDHHRQSEAVSFLDQLLRYHPDHINGLILLADINVNHFKNLDVAEECYSKVLEIDHTNQKALHNLCVLHFERQDFAMAERCLTHTLALHPSVPYIRQHLQVVRNILKQGPDRVFGHLAGSHPVS
ncbi:protein O-mannosyl-transferase Tmtc3-like [Uloborus diversus]|uniref:protein O-mannosyl-transferase Tmtc3-like n=1 Tax=Uloborus diversus TaxID=327109 RepID=UPI00240989B5|nr:protein O-mannosyl-transferase Tmtc3-like [Uloborus diversus]